MSDMDIVTWLRSILHNDRSVELRCQEAANEIERLRDELVSVTYRLSMERDESRREICMMMGGKGGRSSCISPDAVDYAKSRGWDCFKEIIP